METITRFALVQWRVVITLTLFTVLAGVYTYLWQPSQEDPEIVIRTALVTVAFPGMSASRVEQLLVKPVEEAARQIEGIDHIRSSAETGLATIKVELLPTVDNVEDSWRKLRDKMADLSRKLPDGAIGPLVNDDYGRVSVVTLALTGQDFTMSELRAQAHQIQDRLSTLPLVGRIDLHGVQGERIWLQFDRARLSQLGLATTQVLNAIAEQNRILPAGSLITADGMRYELETSGDFRDIAAIGDVPVRTPNGSVVYVRDIVNVERGYVEPPQRPVLFNGKPAVVIAISMIPDSAIQVFDKQLGFALEKLRPTLPLGMRIDTITDQAPIVSAAVADATINLAQTLVTVLVVVMLFLGVRAGAIVGAIVPLTICIALVGMLLWGIPLHRISIAAVIIALGLLVDNGVVITEDIKKRIDAGADRFESALAASRTLALPLLTSSLTTILAFLPLMLAPDATGEFLRALAQVMILSLLASWLLSCTITPLLCVQFLPDKSRNPSTNGVIKRLSGYYATLLSRALRHPLLVVFTSIALFALGIVGLSQVPTGLLPPSDRAQFVVKIELPAGASDAETLAVTQRIATWLSNRTINPDVISNVFYIGFGGPRFFLALSPLDPAPHVAFGIVNTSGHESVAAIRAQLETYLANAAPEARGWTERLFLGKEPPGTLEIRLKGPEIDALYQAGRRIEKLFSAIPGTRDIRTDWANPVLQIDVLIDQERSRRTGLAPYAIADALKTNFDGSQVTDYREGDRVIPIMLRARASNRLSFDDLTDVILTTKEGQPVPLLQVATIAGELKPYIIKRHDLERAITVTAINPDLTASQLLAKVRPELDALDLPIEYVWTTGGEVEASARANAALFKYMPHCLVAIVILLIWQFGSFRRTLIILLTIPLVVIGAALGLLLTNGKLDFNAMLGLFSLAGVIINNGIVLIERIVEESNSSTDLDRSILVAAEARLRPIVMTTLTTIVGLIPLHLYGGELWYGMTVVMMFGLGIGTVLTLGVVPVLYRLMFYSTQSKVAAHE